MASRQTAWVLSSWVNSGSFVRNIIVGLGVLVLAASFSGCAATTAKFRGSTKANVGFFADQTMTLMAQADFSFTRNELVYTREFFNLEGEVEKRAIALEDEVADLFKKIIIYSFDLVVIYETYDTDAERIAAYADGLKQPEEQLLRNLGLPRDTWDKVVEQVRAQKKFMDAIQAAQPIINGAGWRINNAVDEMIEAIDQVAFNMEEAIDKEFADVIRYQEVLEIEKYEVLGALELVYQAYAGEKGAYDSLRRHPAIRKKSLVPKGKPSDKTLEVIADHLMSRLEALARIGREIEPDWQAYRAAHEELDRIHKRIIKDANTARVLTIVWVHGHYEMASGKKAPAEWFDVERFGELAVKAFF